MKIISWNCQMAFRRKNEEILSENPSIIVIQECEHPEKLKFDKLVPRPSSYVWYGDNLNKGVGVFSYDDNIDLEISPKHNPIYRYVIPVLVTGRVNFNLFAIWAMPNKKNHKQRYIGQVWSGLNHYSEELYNSSVIIGDFNWNKIWDKAPRLTGNLTDTHNYLQNIGYKSAYHETQQESLGNELHPTFYLHRKADKPYHIDYCFYKFEMFIGIKHFRLGTFKDWIKLSDHMPMVIEFE